MNENNKEVDAPGCAGLAIKDAALPVADASLATGAELNAATFGDFVRRLRHHLRGEGVDWHYTADALFTVQERKIMFGLDRDYTDKTAVAIEDSMYFSPKEYWDDADDGQRTRLNAKAQEVDEMPFLSLEEYEQWDILGDLPEHTVSGWDERWDVVNVHFTKEAAEAFIKRKKHDYRSGLRVYVDAQIYCWEFNAIIKGLIDGTIALAPASPAGSMSDTQMYRTGYGEGVRRAADLCDAKYQARAKSGHPREASAARALAEEIRNLQSSGPVNAPASRASAPVAWMKENAKEFASAEHKVWMQNAGFGVWHEAAKLYTVPLYAAPLPPVVARKVLTNQEIRTLMHNYSRMHQPGHYSDTEFDCLQDVIAFVRAAIERHLMGESK